MFQHLLEELFVEKALDVCKKARLLIPWNLAVSAAGRRGAPNVTIPYVLGHEIHSSAQTLIITIANQLVQPGNARCQKRIEKPV